MNKILTRLAWAWIIIIGGLMIYPGGIECIVCGPLFTKIIGVVSILIGLGGFATSMGSKSVGG